MTELFSIIVYIALLLSMVILLIYNLFLMKEVGRTKHQFHLILPSRVKKVLVINTFFVVISLLLIASLKIIFG